MDTETKNARVDLVTVEAGKGRVLASVFLENGVVRIEGDEATVASLRAGVTDPVTQKDYMPADGEDFLTVLPNVYRGTYLFASFVPTP